MVPSPPRSASAAGGGSGSAGRPTSGAGPRRSTMIASPLVRFEISSTTYWGLISSSSQSYRNGCFCCHWRELRGATASRASRTGEVGWPAPSCRSASTSCARTRARVAHDRDVHLDVLRDRGRVDVDVDDLGLRRELVHLARHPVVEARADRDQAVRVVDAPCSARSRRACRACRATAGGPRGRRPGP